LGAPPEESYSVTPTAAPTATPPFAWPAHLFLFKMNTGHDLVMELNATDARMRGVVVLAASISWAEFKLPLVVTHVHRTSAEQTAIYAPLAKRGLAIARSPHEDTPSRAVDVRVIHAPDPREYGIRLAGRVNEIVSHGPEIAPHFNVALYEDEAQGVAPHVHFQVPARTPKTPTRLIA
jgi:hypothetical protein